MGGPNPYTDVPYTPGYPGRRKALTVALAALLCFVVPSLLQLVWGLDVLFCGIRCFAPFVFDPTTMAVGLVSEVHSDNSDPGKDFNFQHPRIPQ